MLTIKRDIVEFLEEIRCCKRIAILAKVLLKGDGVSKTIQENAKVLLRKGYDVTIFTMESNAEVPGEVRILFTPKNFILKRLHWLLFPFDFRMIRWVSKLRHFDLLMVHTSPFTYLAWLAKKKYGVKCCLFDHGEPIRYEDFRLLYPKLIERIYAMVMCESIYLPVKKFDYFITNSLFSANILRNRLGVEDIAIIYPKIDESKFNEKLDGKVVREKYKLEDNPLLLFVGRIVPSKGIHLLIEAFKLVRQKIPNAKLIIVGDTSYKNYFLKLKSLVDDSIIFAGYVPDEELPQYYAACDLYVTCSLWEGFNRPLAEAKMCHKPVVAFDIGPHKEVHVNGLLVRVGDIKKFADSIIEVISNSKDE